YAFALIAVEERQRDERRRERVRGGENGATNDLGRQGTRDDDREVANDERMTRERHGRVARRGDRTLEAIEVPLCGAGPIPAAPGAAGPARRPPPASKLRRRRWWRRAPGRRRPESTPPGRRPDTARAPARSGPRRRAPRRPVRPRPSRRRSPPRARRPTSDRR